MWLLKSGQPDQISAKKITKKDNLVYYIVDEKIYRPRPVCLDIH